MSDSIPAPITIVRRGGLPTLRSVIVDGKEHTLGIHKDLRKSDVLARFIPEDARLAVAWVHLGPGEQLDPHEHPIESMIVMCHGRGRILGDLEAEIGEGDVIA